MLDMLFALGQALSVLGFAYGAWLCIRHAEAFRSAPQPEPEPLVMRTKINPAAAGLEFRTHRFSN